MLGYGVTFLAVVAAAGLLFVVGVLIPMAFRQVVPTNWVHIVQSTKHTVSYGKGEAAGNTYYKWPAWVPVVGVRTIELPVSVFDQSLDGYPGYDKGRVPFVIDIMAFFRITDSNIAAQRVETFNELLEQLRSILQGAVRTILATSEIEEILEGRGQFGEMFTKEVDAQLREWGVQNVKCIELMDIRDAEGSKVIANIMAKKKSLIEMESRVAVATNMRQAENAEIDARRQVQLNQQAAEEQVGIRTAEKDQQIGISKQKAEQAIKEEARITAEKQMAVAQVEHVRAAEISKAVQVVAAEQDKQTAVVRAEGEKQQTVLRAEASLEQAKRDAEGTLARGTANAEAEKLLQLAPVQAQITLAQEIGSNEGYQTYLVRVKQIEASQAVGIKQAEALKEADIKVIANTGTVTDGVTSAMDLLTPKGGLQVGAMLEALKNTEVGGKVLAAVTGEQTKANGAHSDRR